MTPWLTPAELHDFTGYLRQADQLAWLKRNGFVEGADFYLTAARKPRLLRAALERRQAPPPATVTPLRAVGPNLAAVR